jgi:DNA-damage-inducible protein D
MNDIPENLTVFEGRKIRRVWNEKEEKWYFSLVDIISVLTESLNPTDYLKKLRKRDPEVGTYIGTHCPQVEMLTETGKKRKTLAGNPEHLLRIIQSIPSSKAEPVKLWLARVGYERMEEMNDPEKALNRSREYWLGMGRSEKWIQQRMMGQEIRNKLTDYWKENEVRGRDEYAILADIIHREWSDLTVKEHKNLKSLERENLRDHMSDAELVFTALAELSTRHIAETMRTKGLEANKVPARKGGRVAKNARLELEAKTGKKIVSGKNFLGGGSDANRLK